MKIALSWLNDYTNINVTPEEFEHGMTMSGTKVESIKKLGEGISNVVTGKINSIEKHPNADKLQICMVDVGNEVLQIITAAENVFPGAIVPVAKAGANLPIGLKIRKTKMRGVESCGMLCSENELALQDEVADGIMILEDDTPIGVDIKEVLGLTDSIVEFEITSNRPDCLSVIGLAREAAVTFRQPFNLKTPSPKEVGDNINDYIKIQVQDSDLCPRYTARMVKNVKIGPSPKWMQDRLMASGVRSINNLVDITNYVMLEYGQPMHAFDLRKIAKGQIIIRRANNGEEITTLDEQKYSLTKDMLVIADGERSIAVAGVMGGENSEIEDSTTTVIFESANFLSSSVRQTAKKLGLRTEASSRYEKGLNPEITLAAVNRACELVCELGCGEVVSGVIDIQGEMPKERCIEFSSERIKSFLGTNIDTEFMVDILTRLGFTVEDSTVKVPAFRNDVEGMADLAEEIARFYGYDNIPSTLLRGETTPGGKNEKQITEDIIRQSLTAQGLYEIITYSFVDPKEYDNLCMQMPDVVRIKNPLGEERSIMRTNTIGSMLETLRGNYNYRNEYAHLFEIGKVYLPIKGSELPEEKQIVTIGMYGGCDFYDIKGIVEGLFDALGIKKFNIEPLDSDPTFHPGQTAVITIGQKKIAKLGQVHPRIRENYEIEQSVYIAEIDFDILVKHKNLDRTYRPLPRYPAITRDIAVIIEDDLPVGKVEDLIKKSGDKIIESILLFDVYKGKQVKEGCKSVAYSITFRAEDKTLTDQEVNEVMSKIIKRLKKQLRVELRES